MDKDTNPSTQLDTHKAERRVEAGDFEVRRAGYNPITDYGGTASMSIMRQIGLMVGLAASVAFGVALVLWSQNL